MATDTSEKALFRFLSEDSDLTALISNRIYNRTIEKEWVAPFLTFVEISTPSMMTHGGKSSGDRRRYQLDTFADDPDEVSLITQTLKDIFEDASADYTTMAITSIVTLTNPTPTYEELLELYRQFFTIDLWTTARPDFI